MPIQFRCPSCDRMLGIARRKAGSTVSCPRCAADVRVPALAGMAVESAGPSGNGSMPVIEPVSNGTRRKRSPGEPPSLELENLPLFERPDFEALLAPPARKVEPPPPPAREPARPPAPVVSLTPTVSSVELPADDVDMVSGLFVSRLWLTVGAVTAAVLIGLAFGAGYWLAAMTVAKG